MFRLLHRNPNSKTKQIQGKLCGHTTSIRSWKHGTSSSSCMLQCNRTIYLPAGEQDQYTLNLSVLSAKRMVALARSLIMERILGAIMKDKGCPALTLSSKRILSKEKFLLKGNLLNEGPLTWWTLLLSLQTWEYFLSIFHPKNAKRKVSGALQSRKYSKQGQVLSRCKSMELH